MSSLPFRKISTRGMRLGTLGLAQCLRINKLCRIHGYIITLSLAFNSGDSLRGIPVPRFPNHPLFPILYFWSMFPMPFSFVFTFVYSSLIFFSVDMTGHWKYFCLTMFFTQNISFGGFTDLPHIIGSENTTRKIVCPCYSNRITLSTDHRNTSLELHNSVVIKDQCFTLQLLQLLKQN